MEYLQEGLFTRLPRELCALLTEEISRVTAIPDNVFSWQEMGWLGSTTDRVVIFYSTRGECRTEDYRIQPIKEEEFRTTDSEATSEEDNALSEGCITIRRLIDGILHLTEDTFAEPSLQKLSKAV